MNAPLRHESAGAGEPAIVLLHPIAMRLEFWRPVAERLSGKQRVISLDLRGHGRNPPTKTGYSIGDLASDVVALCRSQEVRTACFIGCSLGGMVAQGVALLAPELVSSLVLANTTHRMSPQGAEVMRGRAEASAKGLENTIDQDIARWFSEPFRKAHPETVETVRGWALENDPMTVAHGWLAIAALNYESRLHAVKQPVLVTTGSLDQASPPEAARQTAAAFANGRYIEIPDCGHFSPIERPDTFARIIEEFLATREGAGQAER